MRVLTGGMLSGNMGEMPEHVAREIAQVGAMASTDQLAPGHRTHLAGTPAVVLKEISRAEFMMMVVASGLPEPESFATMPPHLHFYAISVD